MEMILYGKGPVSDRDRVFVRRTEEISDFSGMTVDECLSFMVYWLYIFSSG